MLWSLLQFFEGPPGPAAGSSGRIADRYANAEMTNQFGETVRFADAFVDGRALVVNTMYTRCRGACPGTSATLESLRRTLAPVFGRRLTFVSISLDPAADTVDALARYAGLYGAGRRRDDLPEWHFLTGAPGETDRLRRSLGFYDLDPAVDADVTQHDALLLFGNSTSDRWASLPAGVREPVLVEAIRRTAGFTPEQRYGLSLPGVAR